MKKLIAMIGAVATAFGLYATDLTKSAVSFETADTGCSGETLDLEADALWSTDYDDVFKFGVYDGDAYGYTTTTRRSDEFKALGDNYRYLKLSTGTNSLQRLFAAEEAAVDTDPIFMDQLVKFTGFEDTQTVFAAGTKVAVWMSEFVTNETADVEQTLTNLYVAVGKVAGGAVTVKNVKIDGEYKLDTWYRLTIRSIGNIVGDATVTPNALAGFAIYIDGQPITIVAEDRDLLDIGTALIPKAKVLYSKGQLFPSMVAGSTTLKSVGFQGMGAIDDMIVDNAGPDFAQVVDFTVVAPDGVVVEELKDKNGEVIIADKDGKYTVEPGAVTLKLKADGAYVLIPDPTTLNKSVAAGDTSLTITDTDVKVEEAVVIVDETYYSASTLGAAIAAMNEGDHTAEFLQDCEYTYVAADGNEYVYTFAKGTAIEITALEGGVSMWEIENAGELTNEFGAEPNKVIIVNGETLTLSGENGAVIAAGASLTATDCETTLAGALTVAGTFQADTLNLDENVITLGADGKVITKNGDLTYEDFGLTKEADLTKAGPDADDYYTYTLAAGVAFTITDNTANTATYKVFVDDVDVTDNVPALLTFGQTYEVVATAANGYAYEVAGKSSKTLTIDGTAGTDPITVTVPAATAAKVQKGLLFFLTLQEAVDAEGEDDVVLLDNIALDTWVIADKPVTIDFGTFMVTPVEGFQKDALLCVNHGGDVTLKGTTGGINSGAVMCALKFTADGKDLVAINESDTAKLAKLTIAGGVYTGYQYGISGNGTLYDENGVSVKANVEAATQYRGWTSLTITGGTLAATAADGTAVYQPQQCTTVISGGTVTGAAFGVYAKSGTVTVSGGTVTSTAAEYVEPSAGNNGVKGKGCAVVVERGAELGGYANHLTASVTGGTFESIGPAVLSWGRDEVAALTEFVSGGKFKGAALDNALVKFSGDNTAGKFVVDKDGFLVPYEFIAVAQIVDGEKYETIKEALDDAAANDTVTLLADCELNMQYALAKNITLALNGKMLSKDVSKGDTKNKMIIVQNGATLTVDGSVEGSTVKGGLYAGFSNTSFGTIVANEGSYYPAIGKADCAFSANGNAQSGTGNTITITNAKIYSEKDIAVYLAGAGTYTITDCEIDAATGIYMKGGQLDMTGTTIIADGTFLAQLDANGDGATSTGDGIVVDAKTGYAGNVTLNLGADNIVTSANGYAVRDAMSDKNVTALSTLTITGGIYTSATDKPAVLVSDMTTTASSISDGLFKGKPEDALLAEGYVFVAATEPEGYYAVAKQDFGGGSGTEADPYIIATYDHLVELQTKVAAGDNFAGKYFQQTADIDMTGHVWDGIGAAAAGKSFCGIYDGGNFTISNMLLSKTAGTYQRGLFNVTGGTTIKNLTVESLGFDPDDQTQKPGGGVLVGYVVGQATISNVTTKGTLNAVYTAGGMVGAMGMAADYGTAGDLVFVDCTNEVALSGGYDKHGGFMGYAGYTADKDIYFTRCVDKGSITSTPLSGRENAGVASFIGYLGTEPKVTFEDCVAAGTLQSTSPTAKIAAFIGHKVADGDAIVGVGNNVMSTAYPTFGDANATDVTGFTYGKLDKEAGTATYIGTLVKDTEYDQFRNDASETIFTLEAKDDYIAFKATADGITLPTKEQIAVATTDPEIEVSVDTTYADGIKFVAIEKVTEPIPPLPTDPTEAQKQIEKVFATAADQTLTTKVTPANYDAFRTWSRSLNDDPTTSENAVLATPDAFLCFAVSSTILPTGEITSKDVEIKAYNKDTGVIEVKIDGVTPGTDVPAGELAKVLSAVGGEALDGMTADKVNVTGQCVTAGTIQVTVTPKDTTATAFFIKAELVK